MEDQSARITITVNPRMIERIIYWVIIIILAVLLVMSYLGNDGTGKETKTGSEDEETSAPSDIATPPPTPVETTPDASCTDGIKNQDETDVDCGGAICTAKRAANKACLIGDDCAGTFCVASKCTSTPPVQLSGKSEFTLTDASFAKSGSGTLKITGIRYKLTNGLAEDLDTMLIKVYVKNKAGTRCLNQQDTGTCDDSYAEFTIPGVNSGKTTEDGHEFDDGDYTTLMGRYLIEDTGYEPSDSSLDDVSVYAYLYDINGDEIAGKTVSSFKTINPT